ncbi:MAG: hypothetical protein WAU96_13470, partial [Anaerolineae bacterium]
VLTAIGLYYAGSQMKQARNLASGEFLLRIEELLKQHEDVHTKLRPGGAWSGEKGPESTEEWVAVEQYMGLFQRIYELIKMGSINIEQVDDFYGYRVLNITRNPVIKNAKLNNDNENKYWARFIYLWEEIVKRRG